MKYGDTVVLVIGGTAQNALVLQSNQVGEEEHLVVAYLDPKHADSPVMGGQQIRGAVLFQYGVAPAKDGQHIGWRSMESEPELPEPGFFVKFGDLLALSNAVIANGGSDLETSPDATPRSATTLIERLANAKLPLAGEPEKQAGEPFTVEDAARLAQISGSGGLAGSVTPDVIVNPSPSDVDKAVQAQEQAEGSTQQADASQNTPGA